MKLKAPLLIPFYISSFSFSAQQITDSTQLPEVVILENRIATNLRSASQNATYLTATQIKDLPARSLTEALSYIAGVDVRQRGPFGTQADIALRGGTFEQTLVMLNGIKLSDPQTGHHALNLPLPLFAIQQVDVLKGPAARIYGQNAFNGAVNVITRPDSTQRADVQLFGGDFNLRGINAMITLPVGKVRQTLSLSGISSSGYRYNSDFKNASVLYDAVLPLGKRSEWRAMLAFADRSIGANGYYSNRFPDQWEAIRTGLASLSFTQNSKNNKIQIRTYSRFNDDEFRLKRYDVSFYTNTHQSKTFAAELNGLLRSRLGETGYGIDLRREVLISSNLGNHTRSNAGAFLEHKILFAERFDLRGGIYANLYSQYGLRFFPGAEAGFQINRNSRLYGNVGYSYRIPTYTELYYKDLATGSNPELLPESCRSAELGYRYLHNGWRLEGVAFYRETSNLIDYYRPLNPNGNTLWLPRNINEVNFKGLELAVAKDIVVQDSLFSLRSISASYNLVQANLIKNPEIETRYALDHLRQQFVFNASVLIMKKISLTGTYRFIQRQNLNAYNLIDVKLNWQFRSFLQFFAESSNLTNTRYTETGYVQMPGRWSRVGLTLKLQNKKK